MERGCKSVARSRRAVAGLGDPKKSSGGEPEALQAWLLGGFRVLVGDRTVEEDEWRLRKAASLVKLLALAPGHRLHREQILEGLWPGLRPEAATNNLRHALHVARGVLDPTSGVASRLLRRQNEHLALFPDGTVWTDVGAFEDAAAAARRARDPAAYRAALGLYAGDLLPGDPYEDWAEGRRMDLWGLCLSLLSELAALHEERGDYGPAIEALQKATSMEPTREEAHAGLMRLYAITGRRGEALGQYERLAQALSREFAAEPSPASRRLREEISAGQVPPTRPTPEEPSREEPSGDRHNLPVARTSFVGRERELIEVKRALAMTRLLTLTGTGGSGKTRLALEVAGDLAGAYPDGAWLAELAPLSDPDLVPQAVAGALGVREQPGRPLRETLVETLRGRETLLVLDNCEHLVDAAASLVDELLGSWRGLRVLATSREPLGVAGEMVWTVPSMALPGADRPLTAGEIEGYGSARLFVERALYRPSAFVLTEENAGAVAEICRKLDGIPLAIELAAARVGALAVEQISERLSDSLGLLTGGARTATPRQRTLRGALDWSHDLLAEEERILFGRVSVFVGGWTLEAAEAVGARDGVEEGDVLDLLSRLVDKSLVVVEEGGGEARYRLLEPVRQYAREKLESGGEAQKILRWHAEWFSTFAERANAGLRGSAESAWVGRLEAEHDNLRTALDWSLEAAPETGLKIAANLGHFWYAHGHVLEGSRWLEAVLSKTTQGSDDNLRSWALHLAGVLSQERGLYERAETFYEQSLALSRRLGSSNRAAASLIGLGIVAYDTGDFQRAVARTEQALALKREMGDDKGVEIGLNNLGVLVQAEGDFARAQALFEESLEMARASGNGRDIAIALLNLGALAVEQGELVRSEALLLDALPTLRSSGDSDSVVQCIEALAWTAGLRGTGNRAATLLGATEAARKELGLPVHPGERTRYENLTESSRGGTDREAWSAAWAAGRTMSLEGATEYALSSDAVSPISVARNAPPPEQETVRLVSLTRREKEVAALVARGLTNRQIASELVISGRTVDNHVANVLKKLGVRSRERVGARLAEIGQNRTNVEPESS